MNIELIHSKREFCSIIPHGKIDSVTFEDFQKVADEAVKLSENVIVDMGDVDYISSSGLRVLLSIRKSLKDGVVTLVHVNETIMEVLEMTGFTDLLDVQAEDVDPSKIKVIFFDIDGTLLSHTTGQVPESTRRALKQAQENGIRIVVATGRDLVELSKLPVMDLNFDGYLTLNGNICLDKEKHMFAGNEIDAGEVEVLVQIFQGGRIPFVLIGENQRYINYVDDVVIQTQNATHGTIPDIGEYHGEKIYQCLAFVSAEVRERLEQLLDHCSITSWNETGIDIIAKTGGKAAGIQKFLNREGLKRSEVMAFGDGENDMAMLQYAGIGVAMGNGKESLKRAADYVTADVDDDGIEKALKHYHII